ncbi:14160_t:CDS:2 [Funneliformis geosporum]|nr:14160_t:CDS:2 [Funneliformis geosporum]
MPQGRKKKLIWFHFIEGPKLNSSHHEAKCKYCSGKMGRIASNMLKHLKEECPNISEEIHDIKEAVHINYNNVVLFVLFVEYLQIDDQTVPLMQKLINYIEYSLNNLNSLKIVNNNCEDDQY